jgi:hypothetical protein
MAWAEGDEWEMLVGLPVHTLDGHRLGYVLGVTATVVQVSEGYLFRCRYWIEVGQVARVDDHGLVLACTMKTLRHEGLGA